MSPVDPSRMCQLFIEVHDLSASIAFFEKVFGWKAVPAEIQNLVMLQVPDQCSFGIALTPSQSVPSVRQNSPLKMIFAVDEPEPIVQICKADGHTVVGPIRHSGYGLVWEIKDPNGILWGIFKKQEP